MQPPPIVLDTCSLVSALRSQRGASHRLLLLIDSGKFEINVSVSLALEYEDVCKRLSNELLLTEQEIDDVLDYVCRVARHRKVFFVWRPFLPDPKDDMVLELAVAGGCQFIVTFNKSDFRGAEQFGIRIVTPREFLREIGELP